MDLIFVAINTAIFVTKKLLVAHFPFIKSFILPHTHAFFDIRGCHRIGQIDDEFCELFDIDDVFGIIRIGVNDLRASGNLTRMELP